MNGGGQFLGIVWNIALQLLSLFSALGGPVQPIGIPVQTALPLESADLDLAEYEGQVAMVSGHGSSGWIYSAVVVDQAGPILTAVVQRVFEQPDEAVGRQAKSPQGAV